MLTVNVICVDDAKFIVGSISGKKFNVPYFEETFNSLKDKQSEFGMVTNAEEYSVWEKEVENLLKEKEQDIIVTACPDLYKDPKTGKYFVSTGKNGKSPKLSKVPVPEKLVTVILESVEKDIDPTPIVKAWVRFLRNPNFSLSKAQKFADYITALIIDMEEAHRLVEEEGLTFDMAKKRATYNDVAITQEGLLVTKKYARLLTEGYVIDEKTNKAVIAPLYGKEDDTVDMQTGVITKGKAILPEAAEDLIFEPPVMGTSGDEFACGDKEGHIIKVGCKHTLKDWKLVNTNDNISCVKGLHVGGWNYVSCYRGLNSQLLECFVDPMEIGAICDVGPNSDGAIRVREYFIYGAVEGRTKGIYHSSKYAAIKDAEWEEMKKEAIEKANKLVSDIQSSMNDL
jgi:hypothetical protein